SRRRGDEAADGGVAAGEGMFQLCGAGKVEWEECNDEDESGGGVAGSGPESAWAEELRAGDQYGDQRGSVVDELGLQRGTVPAGDDRRAGGADAGGAAGHWPALPSARCLYALRFSPR